VLHDSNSLKDLICLEEGDKLYIDVISCFDLITTGLTRPQMLSSLRNLLHTHPEGGIIK
jgi:hypothetical protein